MIDSFKGQYAFLSNFHPCAVEMDGEIYPTVEHAFQAAKTLDPAERARVRAAKTPGSAKWQGRRVTLRADWEQVKFDIMRELVQRKFADPYLRALLCGTVTEELAEGNTWHDRVWGRCICPRCKGQGANRLGQILMEVRADIMGVDTQPLIGLTALPMASVVQQALQEDIGTGDITTQATVARDRRGRAQIVARAFGAVAGLPVVAEVYRQVDPDLDVRPQVSDGAWVEPGDVLCILAGRAQSILTGERVALNFLQRMSGIATLTARFVERVAGSGARIVDTRKTTPGLRALEKYAVLAGGGHNHRMGLYDAVLIKDNHIVAAGGITPAVQRARQAAPHTMTITVECETLQQVDEALAAGADILLLDNMDNPTRAEAVRRAKARPSGRALTEASGGITEATAAEIARTGVDILSVGALTHSAPALDISLDMLGIEPDDDGTL